MKKYFFAIICFFLFLASFGQHAAIKKGSKQFTTDSINTCTQYMKNEQKMKNLSDEHDRKVEKELREYKLKMKPIEDKQDALKSKLNYFQNKKAH